MQLFHQKLETLHEALSTLHESILSFKDHTTRDPKLASIIRDSMFIRFKCNTDLFLKVLKLYLRENDKSTQSAASPAQIFNTLLSNKMINLEEATSCLEMIHTRNQVIDAHQEAIAQDISIKIPAFYQLMQNIIKKIT